LLMLLRSPEKCLIQSEWHSPLHTFHSTVFLPCRGTWTKNVNPNGWRSDRVLLLYWGSHSILAVKAAYGLVKGKEERTSQLEWEERVPCAISSLHNTDQSHPTFAWAHFSNFQSTNMSFFIPTSISPVLVHSTYRINACFILWCRDICMYVIYCSTP
jgi:hypothetical protein